MMTDAHMTHPIDSLSEKEKEALRLLGQGHDAKSLARHLGLSVHTINERLRDARRKLGASSSREAARQLRRIEVESPHFLADELLADASPGDRVDGPANQNGMRGRWARTVWWIGGCVMSIILGLAALAAFSGSGGGAALAPLSDQTSESAAVGSARRWLDLVDRQRWTESWDETAQSFKALNSTDRWTQVSKQVRVPLGALVSRSLISDEWVPAPPYGYQLVKFRTRYANRTEAIETVSLSWENDAWRVAGIMIE